MKKTPGIVKDDEQDEIADLVRQLHETQKRLQHLTGGEVDAVLHPGGHSYLLQAAQEQLQLSEVTQRHVAETQVAILNALPAHIALLDARGTILSTNEAWRRFATANTLQGPEYPVGENYLEVCEGAAGFCSEEARASAVGIRSVLNHEVADFTMEYPCHSPTEERWFLLRVTPLLKDVAPGAVVMHIDITESKLAEEQLRSKTAVLEAQVNSTLDGILILDGEGNKILQNHRMVELWNIPREFADDPVDQRQREWVVRQVKDPEKFVEKIEYFQTHPDEISQDELELIDGRVFDRYSSPVKDKEGKLYGRIMAIRDITERKLAEEQSRKQIELLNMASRVGKLGAWAVEFPGPKIVWSEEVYRLHEVEPDFKPELSTALDFFPPASRLRLETAIKHKQAYDLELDFITAKGRKLLVRTTCATEMQNGEVSRLFGIFQDLTEEKKIEARFRLLVESNAQGVFFWNTEGEISGGNDAFLNLVGYTREDLETGRISWIALTPPEYAHLDRRALEQLAANGVCELYEKEFIRKDGTLIPILLGAAVFKDTPTDGVCFALDLSERKKLEQQFLRVQRMESIGTMAGGIAHDLNNILAPILMSIDILKLTATDPQAKNVLETIGLSAKRGADIVRQVLSFARGVEGARVEVQPQHLLSELESIIKDTFPKNIQLHFSVSTEPWMILGDPTQIHQILLNLCVNARDAMPRGGTLTVSMENCVLDDHYVAMNLQAKAGRYVQIGVTDTGTGMPPDVLNKIFEPFFTTKALNEGTGLGLSTVIAIVKSHGGNVNVYSEQGKGTTFKIYLPAAEISLNSAKKQTQKLSMPRGNGETILVVDDEAFILSVTTQTLTAFGYRVLGAADGAEAVALYAENRKDIALVLTDMAMPLMDGAAVVRALLHINPAVNIIAASGLKLTSETVQVPRGGIKPS